MGGISALRRSRNKLYVACRQGQHKMVGIEGLHSEYLGGETDKNPLWREANAGAFVQALHLNSAKNCCNATKPLAIAQLLFRIRIMLQCSNSAQSNSFPET
jgi:hypothetical protein